MDSKILTQKFWVKGLWPIFFGLAGPNNFNSVFPDKKIAKTLIKICSEANKVSLTVASEREAGCSSFQ